MKILQHGRLLYFKCEACDCIFACLPCECAVAQPDPVSDNEVIYDHSCPECDSTRTLAIGRPDYL